MIKYNKLLLLNLLFISLNFISAVEEKTKGKGGGFGALFVIGGIIGLIIWIFIKNSTGKYDD
jgi:hypothetical protein